MSQIAIISTRSTRRTDLKRAMRLANTLFLQEVMKLEDEADSGSPHEMIERQLHELVRYELENRRSRLGILVAALQRLSSCPPSKEGPRLVPSRTSPRRGNAPRRARFAPPAAECA